MGEVLIWSGSPEPRKGLICRTGCGDLEGLMVGDDRKVMLLYWGKLICPIKVGDGSILPAGKPSRLASTKKQKKLRMVNTNEEQ